MKAPTPSNLVAVVYSSSLTDAEWENSGTAVASDIIAEEANTTWQLNRTRDLRWHPLSTQEWVQLGRLAQRLISLLNCLLARQPMTQCRRD